MADVDIINSVEDVPVNTAALNDQIPPCSRCHEAPSQPGWSSLCGSCGYLYGVPPASR